ncbi:MAG: HDOD domain-containing protein [Solirubrobacteraceae bacterium]|nr:HDOD domain-containing protein [Solirubrobacteraceae bacterium]
MRLTEGTAAARVVVARQPMFDVHRHVVSYELLFRESDGSARPVDDSVRATARVLSAALGDIGLTAIVGDRRAFVNVDREFLLTRDTLPFSPEQVGLELLEDQEIDDLLLERLTDLVEEDGFVLALDDYVFDESHAPLLSLASIVKVDVLALGVDGAIAQLELLRPYDVTVLAEKLEDEQEFIRCRDAGFELFQGYFFCRPELVARKQIPAGGAAALTAAGLLSRSDVSFEEIEQIVTNDPGLSLRLLRLLNSAAYTRGSQISTVHQALMMLGARRVREWATITALAGLEVTWDELLPTALTRAHALRLLAEHRGDDGDIAFAIGLLSVADAMLGVPMAVAVEDLPIAEVTRAALLDGIGPDGIALTAIRRHEAFAAGVPGVEPNTLARVYLEALVWSQEMATTLPS